MHRYTSMRAAFMAVNRSLLLGGRIRKRFQVKLSLPFNSHLLFSHWPTLSTCCILYGIFIVWDSEVCPVIFSCTVPNTLEVHKTS